ncbi:CxxH/CxxC protein (TIGR04129 family) [Melghirimyces profundicolus]|uniref:CxxH/CxxC protein (TIGR04129 family) n=1 Tax=Melghirimyces profundicolus TaxID=1242148 RepID=A0A2T6C292_9BACL|nr:CxxH/CxxC protein [Melghirimyces profundicolus]PTX62436.1 CxxH/CxxC protein (TIGR04129 family) [Melghirimyces profundicolus]
MSETTVRYACAEHIDSVLDGIVDERGRAPDLILLKEGERAHGCHECGQPPLYRITLPET